MAPANLEKAENHAEGDLFGGHIVSQYPQISGSDVLEMIFLTNFDSVCVASIIRVTSFPQLKDKDIMYSSVPGRMWSQAELSVGIICACLPCLRPLLGRSSRPDRSCPAPKQSSNPENRGISRPRMASLFQTDSALVSKPDPVASVHSDKANACSKTSMVGFLEASSPEVDLEKGLNKTIQNQSIEKHSDESDSSISAG